MHIKFSCPLKWSSGVLKAFLLSLWILYFTACECIWINLSDVCDSQALGSGWCSQHSLSRLKRPARQIRQNNSCGLVLILWNTVQKSGTDQLPLLGPWAQLNCRVCQITKREGKKRNRFHTNRRNREWQFVRTHREQVGESKSKN